MTVLGTAGHVDHGKSSLVRALTGTDPDTLAAEKDRGLTIDLGFAVAPLPSGRRVHLVDVPGHVRFLKNMLAGAGAVSGVIFVVDASEGPMAQSVEHLRLLDLLGVHHGVVAVSKADTVDESRLEDATLEVMEFLEGSPLADLDPIAVDSLSGRGLDELRLALDALADEVGEAERSHRARLWVDRAFTAAGAGTVVAGTLTGAPLRVGDRIEWQPGAGGARIRELHSDHRSLDVGQPGTRVALALSGADLGELGRGVAVLTPDAWWSTAMVDVSVRVLDTLDHVLSRRGAHMMHLGSGEWPVRVRVLGAEALEPGQEGFLRVHLPRPLPLAPGDRYVLRESGRGETIGGGTVLEVAPQRRAAVAQPSIEPERVIADRGWISATDFLRLTGEQRPSVVGEWLVDPRERERAEAELSANVRAAGATGIALAELDERTRALAQSMLDEAPDGSAWTVRDGRLVPAGVQLHHPWLEAVAEGRFDPPPPDGIAGPALRGWVNEGRLIKVGEVWWAAEAIAEAARLIDTLLEANPDGVTVAQVRDTLDSSRKPTLALLGLFDERGVTKRRGDLRVAGPRLGAVAEGAPLQAH